MQTDVFNLRSCFDYCTHTNLWTEHKTYITKVTKCKYIYMKLKNWDNTPGLKQYGSMLYCVLHSSVLQYCNMWVDFGKRTISCGNMEESPSVECNLLGICPIIPALFLILFISNCSQSYSSTIGTCLITGRVTQFYICAT